MPDNDTGRYVILGTIDGILAVLGIIIGVSTTSVDPSIIIKAALGGGIALCLTNGIGSYLAETAVEHGKISSVEKAMLLNLEDTRIEKMARKRIISGSIVHGGSSLVGSMIPILPILLLHDSYSTLVSIALGIIALIVLGAYSATISRESYIRSIVRMVSLGIIVVIACSLLGLSKL
jgi:predicted membrane protein (TIGR00267 family)